MATYTHLPEKSGIYQIVNIITQKRYVGYASNIRQRLKAHGSDLDLNKHPNNHLQKSWNKHGSTNFKYSVLQECPKDQLCLMEDYWVRILKTCERYYGYNLRDTDPMGTPGHSKETVEKLKIAHKGIQPSKLCKQRAKDYWINNPMTEDHKLKMKEARSLINYTQLHREKKGKKVIDCTTGIIYGSLAEVSDLIKIPKYRLSKYLLGTRTNKTNFKYL